METEIIKKEADTLLAPFGSDLQGMWSSTQNAVAKMEHLNEIWCRSKTSWSMEHLTLTAAGRDPWKQMRQISAELERRRLAMSEAKYKLLGLQLDIEEARVRLDEMECEDTSFERKRLALTIAQKEEQIATIVTKFKGAMRDVRDLEALYDARIAKLGEITEEAINAADHRANISRAIAQSIRSMRATGRIDPGNQEYLEQCGINPTFAMGIIGAYLDNEASEQYNGVDELNTFVNEFVALVSD